eukprot:GFYU01003587.1.p2 GENE.GFYU01003587.1~~GFYU01003587.1.p2  ORF type:complete len:231 (-),score=52.47 GFYU01003587.1:161-823(-)
MADSWEDPIYFVVAPSCPGSLDDIRDPSLITFSPPAEIAPVCIENEEADECEDDNNDDSDVSQDNNENVEDATGNENSDGEAVVVSQSRDEASSVLHGSLPMSEVKEKKLEDMCRLDLFGMIPSADHPDMESLREEENKPNPNDSPEVKVIKKRKRNHESCAIGRVRYKAGLYNSLLMVRQLMERVYALEEDKMAFKEENMALKEENTMMKEKFGTCLQR